MGSSSQKILRHLFKIGVGNNMKKFNEWLKEGHLPIIGPQSQLLSPDKAKEIKSFQPVLARRLSYL
jgi:hypothetical protein